MVIFTSDNGSRAKDEGGSNAPCRGTKMTTWEGGQRVPCIVRWPGKSPAGRVCDEQITSMDYMPTLARLAGTTEPQDRKIDGKDISPLIFGEDGAVSPHEVFYYYMQNRLDAVRKGKWKLHFNKGRPDPEDCKPMEELYDLEADIGESTNVFEENPEVVSELMALADKGRADLGDTIMGIEGRGCRPIGFVENAKPLTSYDENHPYIVASYDTPDMPTMCG
jgi:arylsulfatase A